METSSSTEKLVGIIWPNVREDYKILHTMGQGATSVVYEATCLSLQKNCAMKIINLEKCSSSASLDEIKREIASMRNMKNENIVAYYSSFVTGTELCIIMDLCQRGSLLDIIKATQSKRNITNGVFDEYTIATIMRDVLRGLSYIHENALVHRDLKCGNLLVKDDGVIQIADFGVAGFLATQPLLATGTSMSDKRHTFVGTPCWMAPEVMQQKGYNYKADIWSIGITSIELATGQAPYAKYSPMKVLMMTIQNEPPSIDTVSNITNQYPSYGQKYRKFTKACLIKDPNLRSNAKDLLQSPFIKSKAKDRELLCRVLLGTGVPPAPSRFRNLEIKQDHHSSGGVSQEWNFNVPEPADDSSDEEDNQAEICTVDPNNHVDKTITCHPRSPEQKTYRMTLRKRNMKTNELQDISFNYVMNKDSVDLLARELVEAELVDGCDLLLVAHNMSKLVEEPLLCEQTFALNSPPFSGSIANETDLNGFAKVLIRPIGEQKVQDPLQ